MRLRPHVPGQLFHIFFNVLGGSHGSSQQAGAVVRVNVWYPASEESKIIALLQKLNVPWARRPLF